MSGNREVDCVVIGYNELPFEQYAELLRQYGEDSPAYRDFRLSFVEAGGESRPYADLMNYATHLGAAPGSGGGNSAGTGAYPEIFKSGDIPNLAAAYLTNFLNRRGHRTRYVNLFQSEKSELARMLEARPLFVAITTTFYIWNFPVVNMVEYIRRRAPEVKIVVGGPLVANFARNYTGEDLETALADMDADVYVVESQGELTLSRIAECLKNGGDLRRVPNILFREGGELHKNTVEPEFNSLDENYIDWEVLAREVGDLGPTIQTRTARSCAFSCAFCNYPTRAGKLTLTSLDVLAEEFESIRRLGNVKNVVFIDDTFNVPITRFKDLCRMMIEKDYGFNWYSYFRCSNSDAEAIELAARSGCKGVFLGIESGSPTILTNMNKRATIEKYTDGIRMLKENGVLTFGSFITGFPGETTDTVDETNEFISESDLDYYRIQLWYNEQGTPIQEKKEQFGIIGEGFVWNHDTMDSIEAMDEIEDSFLSIEGPRWLPQWSYDFWIIPYLMGKDVDLGDFSEFMGEAQKLMALGVEPVPERELIEKDALSRMAGVASKWAGV